MFDYTPPVSHQKPKKGESETPKKYNLAFATGVSSLTPATGYSISYLFLPHFPPVHVDRQATDPIRPGPSLLSLVFCAAGGFFLGCYRFHSPL